MYNDPATILALLKSQVEKFIRSKFNETVTDVRIHDFALVLDGRTLLYQVDGEAITQWESGSEFSRPFRLKLDLESGKIVSYDVKGVMR